MFYKQSDVTDRLSRLFDGKKRAMISVAGAGYGAMDLLYSVGGTSKFLIGGQINSDYSLSDILLGHTPENEKYVNSNVAIHMATRSWAMAQKHNYMMAKKLNLDFLPESIGVGLTAAVAAPSRKGLGKDRAYLAVKTDKDIWEIYLELNHEAGREAQGEILDLCVVNACLEVSGISQLPMYLDGKIKKVNLKKVPCITDTVENLYEKPLYYDGIAYNDPYEPGKTHENLIFHMVTGNPLTFGHMEQLFEISRLTERKGVFWINSSHPFKGDVPNEVFRNRLRQFNHLAPVLVANHGYLYMDVSSRYPGAGIIIGMDALDKLLDKSYYSDKNVTQVLDTIYNNKTILYVVGREINGEYISPEKMVRHFRKTRHIDLAPWTNVQMLVPVLGRWDVSSTEMRKLSVTTVAK